MHDSKMPEQMNVSPGQQPPMAPPAYMQQPAVAPQAYMQQPVVAPQAYMQQPPQIHVIQQGMGFISVGPDPLRTTCPNCRGTIQTKTRSNYDSSAHIWAFVLCILGCWPCCLYPYCMDSFKSVEHSCPNCNAHIGNWRG